MQLVTIIVISLTIIIVMIIIAVMIIYLASSGFNAKILVEKEKIEVSFEQTSIQ